MLNCFRNWGQEFIKWKENKVLKSRGYGAPCWDNIASNVYGWTLGGASEKRRKNWFGLRGLAKFAKIFTYG